MTHRFDGFTSSFGDGGRYWRSTDSTFSLPRQLFDVQWPRDVLSYLPKFWYETGNFKEKYRLEDVRFYFSACLVAYVCACVASVVVAVKCYRSGKRVPLHAAGRRAMRPFQHLVVPALFMMAWTTVMPMPVGWSSNGYRGNPVENPLVVPLFLFPAAAFLVLISAAGALWLGRERARREQERKKPPRPMISVSLEDLDDS